MTGFIGILLATSTLLTGTFLFFFTVHKMPENSGLNSIGIIRMFPGKMYVISALAILVVFSTMFSPISVAILTSSFLFLCLIVYSLLPPKDLPKTPAVFQDWTSGEAEPIGTGVEVETAGEQGTLHFTISNRSSVRLYDIYITPVVAPGHTLYGLREEYLPWIEPGETAGVDFFFRRSGKKPERIPVRFNIKYRMGEVMVEGTSEAFIIQMGSE